MSTLTGHRYITRKGGSPDGEPVIEGTRIAVRHVVEVWRHGTPAEQIIEAYPHLTMAQVFDALSYYSGNKDEIHRWIALNRYGRGAAESREA